MSKAAHIALIVAGGTGTRMQSSLPKQFMMLGDKPVLLHTIQKFASCADIILVLPHDQIPYWQNLIIQYQFSLAHNIVAGGNTRTQSVLNGLNHIADTSAIVSIHDGVRPFITQNDIQRAYQDVHAFGSSVMAVQPKDSIRVHEKSGKTRALKRDEVYLVQTPQSFFVSKIKEAYSRVSDTDVYTDDASVYEASGFEVHVSEGSYTNIKLTTPEDMKWANALL